MLPTALITIGDGRKRFEKVRALLDPCSEVTLVNMHLARKLGDRLTKIDVGIAGVAGKPMDSARTRTHVYLHSAQISRPIRIQVYGLHRVGIITPASSFTADLTRFCGNIPLADPDCSISRGIDMILGADVYSQLMLDGVIQQDSFIAQRTIFGWVLTGVIRTSPSRPLTVACTTTPAYITPRACEEEMWHNRLVGLLQRFWSLEEVPEVIRRSSADLECEAIFASQHSRDDTGRYVVPLPIRKNTSILLGSSLGSAQRALASVHRRMNEDQRLKEEYNKFMSDYLQHGHMRPVTEHEFGDHSLNVCYIPHHGIWQRCDSGKKLRVVFNASRPTSSGHSLNDLLHPGPKLQNNIATIITRWRRHRFVFCADIKMMFRQIKVSSKDVHLQRIVWSPSESDPVVHYLLLTVTYGETCAPYLALRTLQQLCTDEGARFPEAVDAIRRDLYVDDFLSGADDLTSARHRRDEIVQLLKTGGFKLKKWVSNTASLLNEIAEEDRLRPSWLHFTTDGLVSELGIAWDPVSDCFHFVPPPLQYENCHSLTKRLVLSEIARLFDPAGWVAPLVLIAKIILQDIWCAKIDWDERLPISLSDRWKTFASDLRDIHILTIPRWLQCTKSSDLRLHVFSDASQRAFAAALYTRVPDEDGQFQTHLISAKTKLATLRSLKPSSQPTTRMTIPRLELRGALLAARLLSSVAKELDVPLVNCQAWTDSQVVLHWLNSDRPIGNNFVDNYINHVQELLPGVIWRYVPSGDNPADAATRGATVRQLDKNNLWWNGPSWLAAPTDRWPTHQVISHNQVIPEDGPNRLHVQCHTIQITSTSFIEKFSSLNRLLTAMVRCRRLLQINMRSPPPLARAPLVSVTADELQKEFLTCVKLSQRQVYLTEIRSIEKKQPVSVRSVLRTLDPYLDASDILRVGGRLGNSSLPDEEKHPVILDGHCHLAKLVISWAHERSMHSGYRLTYSYAIQRAWIVGGRTRVRAYLRKCIVCSRAHARPMTQLMAQLPAVRVTPSKPFSRCGVDYAGPFQVLRSRGRGMRTSKGYIAVFVCMSTKAIHLELVGDLTTDSFLGALSRFTARRGRPNEMWSDNATNFRGADLALRQLLHDAELDWSRIEGSLAQEGIRWRFIPPTAPHFGGLWEAGVKSAKRHLRRVAGSKSLTYEEFSTLLAEIEMILNNRPLTPFGGDLDDLDVLTPAHFLTGGPVISAPRPSSTNVNLDHLTHWNLVQGLRDDFWTRWGREYLNTLQQRVKWIRPRQNISPGDLVVIVDPSLLRPTGRWPLGRVVSVHPGQDGLVRVATVKTDTSTYTRPITKIVPLPLSTAAINNASSPTSSIHE